MKKIIKGNSISYLLRIDETEVICFNREHEQCKFLNKTSCMRGIKTYQPNSKLNVAGGWPGCPWYEIQKDK